MKYSDDASNEDINDPSVMDRSSARQYLVFGLLLGIPSCVAALLGIVLLIADTKNNLVSSLSMIGVGALKRFISVGEPLQSEMRIGPASNSHSYNTACYKDGIHD